MLHPDFQHGIDEFNRGNFYACHDTLEAIWFEADSGERNFYQGILQIAVACYHLDSANWQGAATLLGEGTYRLRRYLPNHAGLEVSRLYEASCQLLQVLQQCGPDAAADLAARFQRGELPRPQIVRSAIAES